MRGILKLAWIWQLIVTMQSLLRVCLLQLSAIQFTNCRKGLILERNFLSTILDFLNAQWKAGLGSPDIFEIKRILLPRTVDRETALAWVALELKSYCFLLCSNGFKRCSMRFFLSSSSVEIKTWDMRQTNIHKLINSREINKSSCITSNHTNGQTLRSHDGD